VSMQFWVLLRPTYRRIYMNGRIDHFIWVITSWWTTTPLTTQSRAAQQLHWDFRYSRVTDDVSALVKGKP
jgi:hypothetical protein